MADDPTEQFAALVAAPVGELRLDEAALVVARHAYPSLDVPTWLGRLDDLAGACPEPTLPAVLSHLFGPVGFAGNRGRYHDPRNSYLNDVIARRTGIPITLAIVVEGVARRVGVALDGVNLPGHFVLRDRAQPERFVDAFDGVLLDRAGCAALVARVGGPVELDERLLAPVGPHAVLARVLANLVAVFGRADRRRDLCWALELRTLLPGATDDDRRRLAGALAGVGRFVDAARTYELLAERAQLAGADPSPHQRAARRLRARLN